MALRCAYLSMHRHSDAHFATAGVTADQFVLLNALAEAGPLTQRTLADRIACDPNTLRAMLLLLEKKGLLARTPHPSDRRARLVALTPHGADLEAQLWEQSQALREGLATQLSPTDTQNLIQLLSHFAEGLTP